MISVKWTISSKTSTLQSAVLTLGVLMVHFNLWGLRVTCLFCVRPLSENENMFQLCKRGAHTHFHQLLKQETLRRMCRSQINKTDIGWGKTAIRTACVWWWVWHKLPQFISIPIRRTGWSEVAQRIWMARAQCNGNTGIKIFYFIYVQLCSSIYVPRVLDSWSWIMTRSLLYGFFHMVIKLSAKTEPIRYSKLYPGSEMHLMSIKS